MANSKYIVVKRGFEVAIVFDELLLHSDVANGFGGKDRVISAGFVSVGKCQEKGVCVSCHGLSTSLGKVSREEDAALVERALGIERY